MEVRGIVLEAWFSLRAPSDVFGQGAVLTGMSPTLRKIREGWGTPVESCQNLPSSPWCKSGFVKQETVEVSTGLVCRMWRMAMGTRKQREKQEDIWIAHTELASAPGHPFYQRLNELLEAEGFDEFVEGRCAKFYAAKYGRPSLTPGIYFRSLLIGYFEGIDSERGIAWRVADSLALRRFVGIGLDEYTPDHSTISRTRRLIDLDTHRRSVRAGC